MRNSSLKSRSDIQLFRESCKVVAEDQRDIREGKKKNNYNGDDGHHSTVLDHVHHRDLSRGKDDEVWRRADRHHVSTGNAQCDGVQQCERMDFTTVSSRAMRIYEPKHMLIAIGVMILEVVVLPEVKEVIKQTAIDMTDTATIYGINSSNNDIQGPTVRCQKGLDRSTHRVH